MPQAAALRHNEGGRNPTSVGWALILVTMGCVPPNPHMHARGRTPPARTRDVPATRGTHGRCRRTPVPDARLADDAAPGAHTVCACAAARRHPVSARLVGHGHRAELRWFNTPSFSVFAFRRAVRCFSLSAFLGFAFHRFWGVAFRRFVRIGAFVVCCNLCFGA